MVFHFCPHFLLQVFLTHQFRKKKKSFSPYENGRIMKISKELSVVPYHDISVQVQSGIF